MELDAANNRLLSGFQLAAATVNSCSSGSGRSGSLAELDWLVN